MKLKLLINGTEVEMTMEEARRVFNELEAVFGNDYYPLVPIFPVPQTELVPWYPDTGPYCIAPQIVSAT